jgi:chromosomal replication initiation ATPase DnaA
MTGNIWDRVLSRIETKVNRHSFYTWFKPTSFVSDDGEAIRVRVPNVLFRDWLTKHYSVVLTEALELSHLDYEEFLAAYESMTIALTSHLRELATYREGR